METEVRTTADLDPSLGTMSDGAHMTAFRVYFEDTDGGGVVYHAKYLNLFERARTQFLALAGFAQSTLMAGGPKEYLGFVVRRAAIDYQAPARLDDILVTTTRIARLGRASLDFDQRMRRGETAVARAEIAVACVDGTGRPRAMPEGMRDTLLSHTNA